MVPFGRFFEDDPAARQTQDLPEGAAGISETRVLTAMETAMKAVLGGLAVLALAAGSASAQETKVTVGISGWTGFAPLTLAKEAGIFKNNGVPIKQIFQLDKSYGADGMVVKNDIASIKDIKGKTVAASAPGTSPYFVLAWMLKKNGLSVKDVTVVNMEPGPAAQAFIAGQNDAAMTYEPYLSSVRAAPQSGKIIATTLDYPMIMDTFGCTPKFLEENPKAAKALADSYFEAVEMIGKDQAKAFEIMGADVKQTGEAFGKSASYLRWQDRAANKKFFAGEFKTFSAEAADLLLETGIIKQKPDMEALADTSFIQ